MKGAMGIVHLYPLLTNLMFCAGKIKGRPPSNDIIPETSWVELKQIYDWVVKTKGYKPIVIDADELQKNPGERKSIWFLLVFLHQWETMKFHRKLLEFFDCVRFTNQKEPEP